MLDFRLKNSAKVHDLYFFALTVYLYDLGIRGVQIRSESDPIRSDFGTKIFISDRIGLIKLFRNRIGSDFDIRNKMN
jgi:hypothetical protein